MRLDELDFAKELSYIDGKRAGKTVQRAGTYRELVLEDTLVQDRHSYDDGLAGLLAGGVCKTGVAQGLPPQKHLESLRLPSPTSVYLRPAFLHRFNLHTSSPSFSRQHLESKDNSGRTPLSLAEEDENEAVMKLLLENGAELESKEYGDQILVWAVRKGHEVLARLLLKEGAELEYKDSNGRTPLSWAAERGDETVVKLLLKKRAKLESKDNYGHTPLYYASGNADDAVVKLLLEKGAKLEYNEKWGNEALLKAATVKHEAVVKLLLEKGAKVVYSDYILLWAAKSGHKAVVKPLLKNGTEVEYKDSVARSKQVYIE